MIYIVHGDNLSYSRNIILNQQKKLGIESRIETSPSEIDPEKLKDMVRSFDLFGGAPFIVFDISGSGRTDLTGYVDALTNIPDESTVIVLSGKEITKSNPFLKRAGELKAKVIFNESIPTSNIFKFVDSVFSNNRVVSYKELAKLLSEDTDPFYLFSMLTYGLRNIALIKFDSPLVGKMSPFTKTKSEKQAKNFSEEKIKELYQEFYKIDKEMKTGGISGEDAIPMIMEKIFHA